MAQGVLGIVRGPERRQHSRKRRSKIDSYATESDSEFFAVASEYFFEKPRMLTAEYPEVYRLLPRSTGQDTAARMAAGKSKRAAGRRHDGRSPVAFAHPPATAAIGW